MEVVLKSESSGLSTEPRLIWQKHIEQQLESGLSGMSYCRQNNLNYHNFRYWLKKLDAKINSDSFLEVKCKSNTSALTPTTLCTLHLKDGCFLQIHDTRVLSIILESRI